MGEPLQEAVGEAGEVSAGAQDAVDEDDGGGLAWSRGEVAELYFFFFFWKCVEEKKRRRWWRLKKREGLKKVSDYRTRSKKRKDLSLARSFRPKRLFESPTSQANSSRRFSPWSP